MRSKRGKTKAKKKPPPSVMKANNQVLCETCVWSATNLLLPAGAYASAECALIFPKESGPLVALFGLSYPGEDESAFDVALMVRMACMLVTHPTVVADVNPKLADPVWLSPGKPCQPDQLLTKEEGDHIADELSLYSDFVQAPYSPSTDTPTIVRMDQPVVEDDRLVYHAILCGDTDRAVRAFGRIKVGFVKRSAVVNYILACAVTGDVTSLRYLLTCPLTPKKTVAKVLGVRSYKDPFPTSALDDGDSDFATTDGEDNSFDDDEEDEEEDDDDDRVSTSTGSAGFEDGDRDRDSEHFTRIYEILEGQNINGTKVPLFLLNLNNKSLNKLFYPRVFSPLHPLAVQSYVNLNRSTLDLHKTQIIGAETHQCLCVQYPNEDIAWFSDLVVGMLLKGEKVEGIEFDEVLGIGYPSNPATTVDEAKEDVQWWERPTRTLDRPALQKVAMDLCPEEGRFWMNMNCLMDKDDQFELKVPALSNSLIRSDGTDRTSTSAKGFLSMVMDRQDVLVRSIELEPRDYFGFNELGFLLGRGEKRPVPYTGDRGGPAKPQDRYELLERSVLLARDEEGEYEDNDAEEYETSNIYDSMMFCHLDDIRHQISAGSQAELEHHVKGFTDALQSLMAEVELAPMFVFRLSCLFAELSEGKAFSGSLATCDYFCDELDTALEKSVVNRMLENDENLVRNITCFALTIEKQPDLSKDLEVTESKEALSKFLLGLRVSHPALLSRVFAVLGLLWSMTQFHEDFDPENAANSPDILQLLVKTIEWYESNIAAWTGNPANTAALQEKKAPEKKTPSWQKGGSSDEEDEEEEQWTVLSTLPGELLLQKDKEKLRRWLKGQTRE